MLMSAPVFADSDGDSPGRKTATPIKHVIVLIGENRSFDNIYGTYEPRPGQHVSNLRTRGIIREDGSLASKAFLASQVALNTIPSQYFIHQPASNKNPYATLPSPNTSYLPAIGVTLAEIAQDPGDSLAPFDAATFSLEQLHTVSPVLPLADHLQRLGDAALAGLPPGGMRRERHARRELRIAAQQRVRPRRRQAAL
jgi:hypothetical protein